MRGTENFSPAAVIDPDAYAVGTVVSAWVSMATWRRIVADVFAGTIGANGSVNAKLEQAQDAAGTGAKDITGKAITALTAAGTDSDKQARINLREEELDNNNGFTHVRLSITVASTDSPPPGSYVVGVIYGLDPDYHSAEEHDAATVDEIVS